MLGGALGESKGLGWVNPSTMEITKQPPSLENLTGQPLPAQHLKHTALSFHGVSPHFTIVLPSPGLSVAFSLAFSTIQYLLP